MNSYERTLLKLKETGSIALMELKQLRLADFEKLEHEIKRWCLYDNGNLDCLGRGDRKN